MDKVARFQKKIERMSRQYGEQVNVYQYINQIHFTRSTKFGAANKEPDHIRMKSKYYHKDIKCV